MECHQKPPLPPRPPSPVSDTESCTMPDAPLLPPQVQLGTPLCLWYTTQDLFQYPGCPSFSDSSFPGVPCTLMPAFRFPFIHSFFCYFWLSFFLPFCRSFDLLVCAACLNCICASVPNPSACLVFGCSFPPSAGPAYEPCLVSHFLADADGMPCCDRHVIFPPLASLGEPVGRPEAERPPKGSVCPFVPQSGGSSSGSY